MHISIFIELTICIVAFAVALAAVWRLNRAELYIKRLEEQNILLLFASLTGKTCGKGADSEGSETKKGAGERPFRTRFRVITPA